MNEYRGRGASKGKLLMGIPTYGRSQKMSNPANHDLYDAATGIGGDMGEYTEETGFLSYYEVSHHHPMLAQCRTTV